MEILEPTKEGIKKAADILKKGGLVAFPTETVYGLGADAFNKAACLKIFQVKQRPKFDPLIVHISSKEQITQICKNIPQKAYKLIEKFFPGPLTLVLEKSDKVNDIITGGLGTVAFRMPKNEIALSLIEELGNPIAAPSANKFSYLSPTCPQHVISQLNGEIDAIINGGKCQIGIESTIVKIQGDDVFLLRAGGLPIEEIEKVVGKIKPKEIGMRPEAPGMFKKHYSPKTPLYIIEDIKNFKPPFKRCGLLCLKKPNGIDLDHKFVKIEELSKGGDLKEAALNFFDSLYQLDKENLDAIYALRVPEVGLGRAIMERLRKAAGLSSSDE